MTIIEMNGLAVVTDSIFRMLGFLRVAPREYTLEQLAAACPPWAGFAAPDAEEAAFLLRWLGHWPLCGWLAHVREEPVGFVLLQPDLSPHLRRSRGGRTLLGRFWLTWLNRRPARRGRLLYGAVLPRWQGQGIGRQPLHQTLLTARERS